MKLWQKLAKFFRQSSHDVPLISLVMVVSTYYVIWHRHHRQAEQVVAWQQQLVQAQARRAQVAAAVAQSRLAHEQQRAEAMQQQVAAAQQQATAGGPTTTMSGKKTRSWPPRPRRREQMRCVSA